jgi:DNA-directed RNA polymerase subunit RPC12/RpoP
MEVPEIQARDQWAIVGWVMVVLAFVGVAIFLDIHFNVGPIALMLLIPGVWLLMRWMARAWAYRCPQCGELFQLTALGQFTAINMGDERNVKCPKCGKRNWVKVLRKSRD